MSTDKVRGMLGETGMFVETMLLMSNSPHSASKVSTDMVSRAYHETFGMQWISRVAAIIMDHISFLEN